MLSWASISPGSKHDIPTKRLLGHWVGRQRLLPAYASRLQQPPPAGYNTALAGRAQCHCELALLDATHVTIKAECNSPACLGPRLKY